MAVLAYAATLHKKAIKEKPRLLRGFSKYFDRTLLESFFSRLFFCF